MSSGPYPVVVIRHLLNQIKKNGGIQFAWYEYRTTSGMYRFTVDYMLTGTDGKASLVRHNNMNLRNVTDFINGYEMATGKTLPFDAREVTEEEKTGILEH